MPRIKHPVLFLTITWTACVPEPDTSTLNQCQRESDCPAGETCCNGVCIPVGAACGADTTQPDSDTTQLDTKPPVTDTADPDIDTTQSGADSVCVPECSGQQCGENGCGGVCGSCGAGQFCEGGTCQNGEPEPPLWGTAIWGQSHWAP